jgi:hypothetical protein
MGELEGAQATPAIPGGRALGGGHGLSRSATSCSV